MKNPKIQVKICRNEFSPEDQDDMWRVYQPHYHYSKTEFLQRIPSNNYYAMYYRSDELVGFTGLRIEKKKIARVRQFMIYFGQTVIDPSVRSKALIPRTGIKLCKMFWRDLLRSRAYFWADSLTYKAYLVFAKTLGEYYPSRVNELPTEVQTMRDYLGEKYYGERYCSESGTVRKDAYLISDPNIRQAPRRSIDPDVRFFLKANPRHHLGSGLLTIAPIHRANVWMILRKIAQKTSLYAKYRRTCTKLIIQGRQLAVNFSTTIQYAGL